ncbi:MAG: hypothetical protein V1791_07335 [Pseudomonadota bacterium]
MTKEDWAMVEKALSGTYGFAKLQVDGHAVTFERRLVTKNRLGIVTFVDGKFNFEWVSPKTDHPEQRFLRRKSELFYKPKERAEYAKWSKRLRKDCCFDIDKKFHFFTMTWPSATAIRRHYQKTFQNIELIEVVG